MEVNIRLSYGVRDSMPQSSGSHDHSRQDLQLSYTTFARPFDVQAVDIHFFASVDEWK